MNTNISVSVNNSTNVPLDAYHSFTGIADSVTDYCEIDINIAGYPLDAPGSLYFEFSPDGHHWDISKWVSDGELSGPTSPPIALRIILPYFRVRYVNGNIPQTEFRIMVMYHRTAPGRLTRFLNQTLNDTEGVEITRSILAGSKAGGTYDNVMLSSDNALHVDGSSVVQPVTITQTPIMLGTPQMINTSGTTTIYTPASGKSIRLKWLAMATPDTNTSTVIATITLSGGNIYTWPLGAPGAFMHSSIREGAPNGLLAITLSASGQPVYVNLDIEEF